MELYIAGSAEVRHFFSLFSMKILRDGWRNKLLVVLQSPSNISTICRQFHYAEQ